MESKRFFFLVAQQFSQNGCFQLCKFCNIQRIGGEVILWGSWFVAMSGAMNGATPPAVSNGTYFG